MSEIKLTDLIPNNSYEVGQIIDKDGDLQVLPLSFNGLEPISSDSESEDFIMKSFNITGTEPEGMSFYKCASVDTTNHTWSGYKLQRQSNGGYIIAQTITSNLKYNAIKPIVNQIYYQNCMLKIGYVVPVNQAEIPTSDLFYYLPLKNNYNTSIGANTSLRTGTLNFVTEQGIQCAQFDGNQYLQTTTPENQNNMTFSFWAKTNDTGWNLILGMPYDDVISINSTSITFTFKYVNGELRVSNSYDLDATFWNHYAIKKTNTFCAIYINGQKVKEFNGGNLYRQSDTMNIGAHRYNSSAGRYHGFLTSIRIYYTALTDSEIIALANQFTPTES